jgi:hypothetical protein
MNDDTQPDSPQLPIAAGSSYRLRSGFVFLGRKIDGRNMNSVATVPASVRYISAINFSANHFLPQIFLPSSPRLARLPHEHTLSILIMPTAAGMHQDAQLA